MYRESVTVVSLSSRNGENYFTVRDKNDLLRKLVTLTEDISLLQPCSWQYFEL